MTRRDPPVLATRGGAHRRPACSTIALRHTVLASLLLLPLLWLQAGGVVAVSQEAEDGEDEPQFSYPIGDPGAPLGDGFVIRHGYATENTWYLPGYLHTGEDWYRLDGDTAGAGVYAVGAGEVVFAGSDYPGRVVIVRHEDELFSMYGHLDPALAVETGDTVERGEALGTVAERGDDVPNHLHFEMRTFLTTRQVNGSAPRYDFGCGIECPPGPGYWPIDAPDHPSDLGWLNPTHVIASSTPDDAQPAYDVVAAASPAQSDQSEVALRSEPDDEADETGQLPLKPGERLSLLEVRVGAADSEGTSAESYDLWYRIESEGNESGWVRAAVPASIETGSDGRPSTVRFTLLPAVEAQDAAVDE